jgi:hypothetical protein
MKSELGQPAIGIVCDLDEELVFLFPPQGEVCSLDKGSPYKCYASVVQKNCLGRRGSEIVNVFSIFFFSFRSSKALTISNASCSSSPRTIIIASDRFRFCLQLMSGVDARRSDSSTGSQFLRPAGKRPERAKRELPIDLPRFLSLRRGARVRQ